MALSFGLVLAKHGQPRDNWSAPEQLFNDGVVLVLLYAGGFFG